MITQTDIDRLNKEYAAFERDCRFWIDKIGLSDWKISIKQLSPIDERDTLAQTTYSVSQKRAFIEFFGTLGEETCTMLELALHEVLHIMLAPAMEYKREDDRESHAIIRRLIPLLMPLFEEQKSLEDLFKAELKKEGKDGKD